MARSEQARDVFEEVYGYSTNFITPDVIEYGFIGDFIAYEISVGQGITGKVYGFTVLIWTGRTKGGWKKNWDVSASDVKGILSYDACMKMSDVFLSLDDVRAHIKHIEKECAIAW